MFINIGLDTFVEMDLSQASKFVAARIKGLEAGVQSTKLAQHRIKANVRIMLEVCCCCDFCGAFSTAFAQRVTQL